MMIVTNGNWHLKYGENNDLVFAPIWDLFRPLLSLVVDRMPRIAGVESDIAENIYWVSSKRCLPFVSSAMTSYVQLLCGTLATSAADGIIVGHGGLKDPAEQSLNG